jgi:hypothetical protein
MFQKGGRKPRGAFRVVKRPNASALELPATPRQQHLWSMNVRLNSPCAQSQRVL